MMYRPTMVKTLGRGEGLRKELRGGALFHFLKDFCQKLLALSFVETMEHVTRRKVLFPAAAKGVQSVIEIIPESA